MENVTTYYPTTVQRPHASCRGRVNSLPAVRQHRHVLLVYSTTSGETGRGGMKGRGGRTAWCDDPALASGGYWWFNLGDDVNWLRSQIAFCRAPQQRMVNAAGEVQIIHHQTIPLFPHFPRPTTSPITCGVFSPIPVPLWPGAVCHGIGNNMQYNMPTIRSLHFKSLLMLNLSLIHAQVILID